MQQKDDSLVCKNKGIILVLFKTVLLFDCSQFEKRLLQKCNTEVKSISSSFQGLRKLENEDWHGTHYFRLAVAMKVCN